MKKYRTFFLFALCLVLPVLSEANVKKGLTLEQCFDSAVSQSETIADQDQRLIQLDEKKNQAVGLLFPTIEGSAAYFTQEALADPVAQSFFPREQPTVKLTLTQPLFQGGKEYAALRQVSKEQVAQQRSKDLALMNVYQEVVDDFFGIVSKEQEIENLETELRYQSERVRDLQERVRIGQSRSSDSLTVEAARSVVEAQIMRTSGALQTLREHFHHLTGLERTSVLSPEGFSTIEPLQTLDRYLELLENRPDILEARERVEVVDESIVVARSGHFPTASILGNYYLVRPKGVFQEVSWDVQGLLTVPLFSGGVVSSQVREAASQKKQAEIALEKLRRSAAEQVRSLFVRVAAGKKEIAALEKSTDLSERNFKVLKSDYTRGLARNIDVLQALTQFQQSKRSLDQAQWQTVTDRIKLDLFSGINTVPYRKD